MLQTSSTTANLLVENLLFLAIATSFLVIVGWAWRHLKPYNLPQTLPQWFNVWFLTVQIGGVVLPLLAMFLWGVWWGYSSALTILASYLAMLGLQILSESLALRQFHSVVFVIVPYLYIPYRIWQLYEGLVLLSPISELLWIRNLLILEVVLWVLSYALNLAQLPRLMQWETNQSN